MSSGMVPSENVRYHVIKDYSAEVTGESDEEIAEKLRHDPAARALRYSIVSTCPHPGRGTIFCGATNTGQDLLLEFDPRTGAFRSCNYARIGDEREAKIHRGLWLDETENALYFATSTLSGIQATHDAPGAPIVRYDIDADSFEVLCRPKQGEYIQATNYDAVRKLIHFFSIPSFAFGVFDVAERRVRHHIVVESIPHISAIDDDGGIWGTFSHRHAFFRYDPDADAFDFFDEHCVLPTAREGANVMYSGAGPVDSMLNGGDGYLYIGTALGELYRLDPRTRAIDYLGKPHYEPRIQGLALGADGLIYGAGGRRDTFLFRYDRATNAFTVLSDLTAPDGKRCQYPHNLLIIDGTATIGETDNRTRSGYLWQVTL